MANRAAAWSGIVTFWYALAEANSTKPTASRIIRQDLEAVRSGKCAYRSSIVEQPLYAFLAAPFSAEDCAWIEADGALPFTFSIAVFFGFFGSRPERFCPLAIVVLMRVCDFDI